VAIRFIDAVVSMAFRLQPVEWGSPLHRAGEGVD
jgi:hypothetical protein